MKKISKEELLQEYRNYFVNCEEVIYKHYPLGSGLKFKIPNREHITVKYAQQITVEQKRDYFLMDASHRILELGIITQACKNPDWKNVLEIGTGWGLTSLSLSEALAARDDTDSTFFQTIDYIDFSGRVLGSGMPRHEIMLDLIENSKLKNWKHSGLGSDKWFSSLGSAHKFDVAFIDGEHSYKQTKKDWKNVESSTGENSIVFFHDLNIHTESLDYPNVSLKCFEEIEEELYNKIILHTPFRLGVVCRKNSEYSNKWLNNALEIMDIGYDRIS